MARPGQVMSARSRVDSRAYRVSAIMRGDACGHANARFDTLRERGAELRRIASDHRVELQMIGTLLGQGKADEAPAEFRHEVDRFRCDMLCSEGQVSLILAIFIVDDDEHASARKGVESFWYGNKR